MRLSAAIYTVVESKKKNKALAAMVEALESEQAKVTTTEVKVPKKTPAKKTTTKKAPSKKPSR